MLLGFVFILECPKCFYGFYKKKSFFKTLNYLNIIHICINFMANIK